MRRPTMQQLGPALPSSAPPCSWRLRCVRPRGWRRCRCCWSGSRPGCRRCCRRPQLCRLEQHFRCRRQHWLGQWRAGPGRLRRRCCRRAGCPPGCWGLRRPCSQKERPRMQIHTPVCFTVLFHPSHFWGAAPSQSLLGSARLLATKRQGSAVREESVRRVDTHCPPAGASCRRDRHGRRPPPQVVHVGGDHRLGCAQVLHGRLGHRRRRRQPTLGRHGARGPSRRQALQGAHADCMDAAS